MGLRWMPSWPQVAISSSSSKVPMPPGRATKPSASSAISALRACMVATTRMSATPRWASSRAARPWGITPTTLPPAARAWSARTPMSPIEPPPNTTPIPRETSPRARALAASA